MPGEVRTLRGDRAEVHLESGATFEAPGSPALAAGQRCHAVVRPEKLVVDRPEATPPDGPAVAGTVESSVYLGTATQLIVSLADGTRLTALVPNVDEVQRSRLPGRGEGVRLSWAAEHTHLIGGHPSEGTDEDPNTMSIATGPSAPSA